MVKSRFNSKNNEVVIDLGDKFDYSVHKSFRTSYSEYIATGTSFTVALSKTQYIDSSALGMLLLLKEHADKIRGTVVLRSPSEAAMKILKVANFESIFTFKNY